MRTTSIFYADHLFRTMKCCKQITKLITVFIIFTSCISILDAQTVVEDPYKIGGETKFNYYAYLKLKQMDSIYQNSEWERSYYELLSVLESRYGKYIESGNRMDKSDSKSRWGMEYFSGVTLIPMSVCLDSLVSKHAVTMINEQHFNPVYRAIAYSFLSTCYKHGYRYLAVEALNETDVLLNKRKYPLLHETGFYTDEPVFGDFVRQALNMGYTLIPYDTFPQAGISRDEGQALNIINQTIARNPSAKILVLAGMGHNFDSRGFKTMGWYFKEHTEIDPLTINFLYFSPRYNREYEGVAQSYFLDIADSLSIREPLFLYDTINKKFKGIGTDIIAIIPRTTFINQTIPAWKVYNNKVLYTIDRNVINKYGIEEGLISAHLFSEKRKGVPIDQLEFKKTDKEIVLVLYKGKYVICLDNGVRKKTFVVKVE